MDYTMAQAKRDFDRGFLAGARIVPLGLGFGFGVTLESRLGMNGMGWLVDARSKEQRQFKTVDAALRAVEAVGFVPKALDVAL